MGYPWMVGRGRREEREVVRAALALVNECRRFDMKFSKGVSVCVRYVR